MQTCSSARKQAREQHLKTMQKFGIFYVENKLIALKALVLCFALLPAQQLQGRETAVGCPHQLQEQSEGT